MHELGLHLDPQGACIIDDCTNPVQCTTAFTTELASTVRPPVLDVGTTSTGQYYGQQALLRTMSEMGNNRRGVCLFNSRSAAVDVAVIMCANHAACWGATDRLGADDVRVKCQLSHCTETATVIVPLCSHHASCWGVAYTRVE